MDDLNIERKIIKKHKKITLTIADIVMYSVL